MLKEQNAFISKNGIGLERTHEINLKIYAFKLEKSEISEFLFKINYNDIFFMTKNILKFQKKK